MRPLNLYKITRKLETKESALQFLRSQGTLPKSVKCDKCNTETTNTGNTSCIYHCLITIVKPESKFQSPCPYPCPSPTESPK